MIGELKEDALVAKFQTTVQGAESSKGLLVTNELDEGEALNSAKVLRAPIHIFRDVNVLDGSILLKSNTECLNSDVTRQVARNHCLDATKQSRRGCGPCACASIGVWGLRSAVRVSINLKPSRFLLEDDHARL